jgi:hypothetical protein
MYFLMTAAAAVVATVAWYVNAPGDKYKLGLLSSIFWGAALMWFIDHVMAYLTEGGEFFDTTADAALLGVSVIILGSTAWLVTLLISDPKGVFAELLKNTR